MPPPGSASRARPSALTSYDVLVDGAPMASAILATQVPHLWILPGSVDLAGAELELASALGREFRLRNALATSRRGATTTSSSTARPPSTC